MSKPCAVCQHRKRKCLDDCIFRPYFSGDNKWKLKAILECGFYRIAQIKTALDEVPIDKRQDVVDALVFSATGGFVDQMKRQTEELTLLKHLSQSDLNSFRGFGSSSSYPVMDSASSSSVMHYGQHQPNMTNLYGLSPLPPSLPISSINYEQQLVGYDAFALAPTQPVHQSSEQGFFGHSMTNLYGLSSLPPSLPMSSINYGQRNNAFGVPPTQPVHQSSEQGFFGHSMTNLYGLSPLPPSLPMSSINYGQRNNAFGFSPTQPVQYQSGFVGQNLTNLYGMSPSLPMDPMSSMNHGQQLVGYDAFSLGPAQPVQYQSGFVGQNVTNLYGLSPQHPSLLMDPMSSSAEFNYGQSVVNGFPSLGSPVPDPSSPVVVSYGQETTVNMVSTPPITVPTSASVVVNYDGTSLNNNEHLSTSLPHEQDPSTSFGNFTHQEEELQKLRDEDTDELIRTLTW